MGLTIHYSGKLRSAECIPALIEEAIDIVQGLKWEYQLLPDHPDVPVKGVLISPEGSEPLWLTFQADGSMCNPILYEYVLEQEGTGIPADAEQWLFTKTQYAGVEAHMAIIRLLRYFSSKYFERFELHDDSRFWETGDEALCRRNFEKYDLLLGMVGAVLDGMEAVPDESAESLAERVEKLLTEKLGSKSVK